MRFLLFFVTSMAMAQGIDSGTLTWTAAPNYGPERTVTITVGNEYRSTTFTVTQASGCTWVLNLSSVKIPYFASTQSVNIGTVTGCEWSAESTAPWIHVADSGDRSKTISYSVDANLKGQARIGTLVAGGVTLTVTQTGKSGK